MFNSINKFNTRSRKTSNKPLPPPPPPPTILPSISNQPPTSHSSSTDNLIISNESRSSISNSTSSDHQSQNLHQIKPPSPSSILKLETYHQEPTEIHLKAIKTHHSSKGMINSHPPTPSSPLPTSAQTHQSQSTNTNGSLTPHQSQPNTSIPHTSITTTTPTPTSTYLNIKPPSSSSLSPGTPHPLQHLRPHSLSLSNQSTSLLPSASLSTISLNTNKTHSRPASIHHPSSHQLQPSPGLQSVFVPPPPSLPHPTRSSTSNTKKGSKSGFGSTGGIASALAMSGVALANSTHQPLLSSNPPLHHHHHPPSAPPSVGRLSVDDSIERDSDHPQDRLLPITPHSRSPAFNRTEIPLLQTTTHSSTLDGLSSEFEDQLLGTGYAVASRKRNSDFHSIFKGIPEDDYLIEGTFLSLLSLHLLLILTHPLLSFLCLDSDYGCALQRDILVQGRLYISEQHLCFNANIFGWVTTVSLSWLLVPLSLSFQDVNSKH